MAPQQFCMYLFLGLLPVHVCNEEKKDEEIEKFVTYYHCKPDPDRVPAMLDLTLKSELLNEKQNEESGSRVLLAHAFGHMARGNPKLVRLYESRFPGTSDMGKLFLIEAFRVCGDSATHDQLEKWSRDPDCRGQQKPLEAAANFLADPKRRLPRDQPARHPGDLDCSGPISSSRGNTRLSPAYSILWISRATFGRRLAIN